MATFIIASSWAPVSTRRPRLLTAKFGDGYEQRGLDGLHPDLQSWALVFGPVSVTDADGIETFFITNNTAVTPFDWTPPRSTVSSKWLCRTWTRTNTSPNTDTMTATFVEVADL